MGLSPSLRRVFRIDSTGIPRVEYVARRRTRRSVENAIPGESLHPAAGDLLDRVGGATAAEETPIGRRVEDFSLPDFHGQSHSLADYRGQIVVLAFLGTECPLAKNYTAKLHELANEFATQKVAFLGIDANLQDSLTEMAAFARVHGVTFPLLKDNNNVIADRLGAIRTPEVFLLDRDHVIRYWGRVDDQFGFKAGGGYAKPKQTERNLADAIQAVLDGQPVAHPVTKADGCLIGRVSKTPPHGESRMPTRSPASFRIAAKAAIGPTKSRPFSMTSYDEVIGWAAMIREVVTEGRMPPWYADPAVRPLQQRCPADPGRKGQIQPGSTTAAPRATPKTCRRRANTPPAGRWASRTRSST